MSNSELIVKRIRELQASGMMGSAIANALFAEGFNANLILDALEVSGYYIRLGSRELKISNNPNEPGYVYLAAIIGLYTWPSILWPPVQSA